MHCNEAFAAEQMESGQKGAHKSVSQPGSALLSVECLAWHITRLDHSKVGFWYPGLL